MRKVVLVLSLMISINVYAQDNSNWMRDNYQYLSSKPLNQIPMLATHDSGSYAIKEDSPFCRGEAIAGRVSINFEYLEQNSRKVNLTKTQPENLLKQLNYGVRYFDIRVCYYNGQFYTNHYYLSDNYTNVVPQITEFLKLHPRELVILDFDKHLYAESSVTGYLDGKEMDLFITTLNENFKPFIVSPKKIKELPVTLYSKLLQHGNLVLLTSNPYLLKNYSNLFFDRNRNVDSRWANQADADLLMNYLEKNVIPTWDSPRYRSKLKVLQSQVTMPNNWEMLLWQQNSLLDLAKNQTNPLLLNKLNTDWQNQRFNIIMTDDTNNSELMYKYILPQLNRH